MRERATFGLTPVARRLVDVDVPLVVGTALATFAAVDDVARPARRPPDAGVFWLPDVVAVAPLPDAAARLLVVALLPPAAFAAFLGAATERVFAALFFAGFDAAPADFLGAAFFALFLVADVFVVFLAAGFCDAVFLPPDVFFAAPAVVFFAAVFFFAAPAAAEAVFVGLVPLPVFAPPAALAFLAPAPVLDAAARLLLPVSSAVARFALVPLAFSVFPVDFAISFTLSACTIVAWRAAVIAHLCNLGNRLPGGRSAKCKLVPLQYRDIAP